MPNNLVFKTSTSKTIDNLLLADGSPNTNVNGNPPGTPIEAGTVYFTSDGFILYDIDTTHRVWMSKEAYSAIYAKDIADTADIASTYSGVTLKDWTVN